MNNKKGKRFIIGLTLCFCLIAIYFYNKEEQEITFTISDDIISFATRDANLICLTSNGQLLEYDKKGTVIVVDQTDVKFISNFGELFLIKNDGSIVINLDDNYNGDIIGKIPGAKSGCVWSDMIVIVTDYGELFFYTDNSEVSFDFNNTEIVNGWTKVNDVSKVIKAYVYRNSGRDTIFALNTQGEVSAIGFEDSFFHKISEDLRVVDISSHGVTLILLDEQGDLYQIGPGMMGMNTGFYTKIDKMDNLSNVVKISTSYSEGAAITSQGEVYVWRKEGYGKGKAWENRTAFGKVLDGEWDNLIISDYLYVIKKGVAKRLDYKSLVEFKD